jgi:hypothetical protein
MNTVQKIVLLLNIVGWLLVSCNNLAEQNPNPKPSVPEERDKSKVEHDKPKEPVRKPNLYIKAISGLRLRKEPNPATEPLVTIPFGAMIQPLDSISGSQFVIGGKSGKMIEVAYKNHHGYVFEAFTTAGPVAHTRRLGNGKYCFKSFDIPGYEYLAFTVDANRITNGSGDGHTESEEASWIVSFTGIFDEEGNILVKTVVENESGIQAPCLETWEIADKELLVVKRGRNRVFKFKKVDCAN